MRGKAELDALRPGRYEMVNPQIEILSASDEGAGDSTEVGRIVPIYEAIGGISSRMLRRIIYGVLSDFDGNVPDPLPEEIRQRYRFPTRREALLYTHFPPKDESVELLNTFREPSADAADFRGVFLLPARAGAAPAAGTSPARDRHARTRGESARGTET